MTSPRRGRRDALALMGALTAFAASACATRRLPPGLPPPEPALGLDRMVDLVPAAGLVWLVEARPAELLRSPALGPAIALVLPDDHFEAFARRNGVDLRQCGDLVVAGFPDSTLGLARVPIDPGHIEAAFAERAVAVEGRATEREVTRVWGTVRGEREQVATFGRQGAGIERGHLGPLRTACYFAEGRLKRSLPALRAEPLLGAANLLGDAPLRGFAPGPFEGAWAAGLGGLLRATTGIAAAARPARTATGEPALRLTILLLGDWGEGAADSRAAAERLGAAFHVLAEDPLGRLTQLSRPVEGPHVEGDRTALRLEVVLDPTALARGVRDATSAAVADIVAFP
jgi:hypothetical protein